jgi:Putative GTPase activating protein for Arf
MPSAATHAWEATMTDSNFSNNTLTSLESLVLECQLENAREDDEQRHTIISNGVPDGNNNSQGFHEMPAEDRIYVATLPGNNTCADCGASDTEWASVTYGILLCAECSGVHRYAKQAKAGLLMCRQYRTRYQKLYRCIAHDVPGSVDYLLQSPWNPSLKSAFH